MTDTTATPASALDFVQDRVVRMNPRTRVLILQHPQEQDVLLGTAPLVEATLDRSVVRVGLSWASLAHALEDDTVDPARWAVMYRGSLGRQLTTAEENAPFVLLDRKIKSRKPDELPIDGLVILDGTWSQAKSMWWRNAWLLKLNRVILHPKAPSAYGRLRKQPSNQHVSTLEATALALDGLGEEPDVGEQLRKVFRTLCQRARDAGVSNRTERDAPEALAVVKSVAEGKPIAKRSPKRPRRDDVAF